MRILSVHTELFVCFCECIYVHLDSCSPLALLMDFLHGDGAVTLAESSLHMSYSTPLVFPIAGAEKPRHYREEQLSHI